MLVSAVRCWMKRCAEAASQETGVWQTQPDRFVEWSCLPFSGMSLLPPGSKWFQNREYISLAFILFSQSCYNKLSQTGGLELEKFVILVFWRLEIQNQYIGKVKSYWRLQGRLFSFLIFDACWHSLACSYLSKGLFSLLCNIPTMCLCVCLFTWPWIAPIFDLGPTLIQCLSFITNTLPAKGSNL